jgi:hypothetical protein
LYIAYELQGFACEMGESDVQQVLDINTRGPVKYRLTDFGGQTMVVKRKSTTEVQKLK